MSNRTAEYRQLIEDVTAGAALLEDDELMELRDMLARIERKMRANMPAKHASEETVA